MFDNIQKSLRNYGWKEVLEKNTSILIFVTSYFWAASRVTALDLALATCRCIKFNLLSNHFQQKSAVIRWVLRTHFLCDICELDPALLSFTGLSSAFVTSQVIPKPAFSCSYRDQLLKIEISLVARLDMVFFNKRMQLALISLSIWSYSLTIFDRYGILILIFRRATASIREASPTGYIVPTKIQDDLAILFREQWRPSVLWQ